MSFTTHAGKRLPNLYLLLAAIAFLAIASFRACNILITHDEAITFLDYVAPPSLGPVIEYGSASANNHLLNTWLTQASVYCFGTDVWALRIPSLVALSVFMAFYACLLRQLFRNPWHVLALFILLQLNPFFFDFWSLSRGYALSWAGMMGGVCFIYKYHNSGSIMHLAISLPLAATGVVANFSLLYFFVALAAGAGLLIFIRKYSIAKLLSHFAVVAVISIALLLFLKPRIAALQVANALYFGGTTSFLTDTIGSIVQFSVQTQDAAWVTAISAIIVTLLIAVLLVGCKLFISTKTTAHARLEMALMLIFLLAPAFISIVHHWLLGGLFLMERAALFFYPLYVLAIALCIKHILTSTFYKGILAGIVVLCGISFFATQLSFNHFITWPQDMHTKAILDHIIKRDNRKQKSLFVVWLFAPPFRYYTLTKYRDYFKPVSYIHELPQEAGQYDYYLIEPHEIPIVAPGYTQDTTIMGGRYILLHKP